MMFDKGMIKMVGDDTQWTEEGKDYLAPLDHFEDDDLKLGDVFEEWRPPTPQDAQTILVADVVHFITGTCGRTSTRPLGFDVFGE